HKSGSSVTSQDAGGAAVGGASERGALHTAPGRAERGEAGRGETGRGGAARKAGRQSTSRRLAGGIPTDALPTICQGPGTNYLLEKVLSPTWRRFLVSPGERS
ncbi:Hypothetical predicted protein, partial [Olea europaea subsp. europaea]